MRLCASSHLDASPRRHSSRSRPTSPTASPWAAQWALGHRSWSSTNIPFCISTRSQSGFAFVVRRPTSHNCVYFTHFRLPRKKRLGFIVPRHAKLRKKTTANWTLLLAPLSHTCLCCLPVPTPDSRPSRRARSAHGWSLDF